MQNTWKPRLIGASVVAVLAAAGCFNFEDARQRCEDDGRCGKPDGGAACKFESEDDEPDDDFRDRNCDGVDGKLDGGIFVDPVRGTDNAPGTAAAPLRTLREALERAKSPGAPKQVYLAQGAYNETALTIDSQVSLHGAYGGRDNNWTRKSDFTSFVDGGPIGLVIKDLPAGSPTVLDHLTVHSDNATEPGSASIALQVINAQDVKLRYGTFIAGLGAQGYAGDAGTQGLDGGVGTPGTNANGSVGGDPGPGGTGPCGGTGGDGQGGPAGNSTTAIPGTMGLPGLPSSLGGQGGAQGTAGVQTSTSPNICRAGGGGNGEPGKPGGAGTPGSTGSGTGELIGTQWVANQHGGNGTPGGGGGGGGGGGSGGGCYRAGTVNGAGGAGSGGGGGGGCGGGAGKGGGGGGASIAVLLVGSNVQFEGDTVLRTLGGGRGGTGGEGGPGGNGGAGGAGGNLATTSDPPAFTYISYSGDGGTGGPGGSGGPGGPGGGGGGGPSVGIWCGTSSAYTGTVTNLLLGDGGVGGTPGTGGNAGQAGQQLQYPGCP